MNQPARSPDGDAESASLPFRETPRTASGPFGAWIKAVALLATVITSGGALAIIVATHDSGSAPRAPVVLPPAAIVRSGEPTGSGAYVGPARPGAAKRFGAWRGVPVSLVADNLGWNSWQYISHPDWWLSRWDRSGLPLVLGVPMLPDNKSTSIEAGATGHYNKYFRQLAEELVRYGDAGASLRIGWEMTGDWYSWSAQPNPAAWIAYYRQIVITMRSVSGTHFTFDWNPNMGDNGLAAAAAYPGDGYVDMIGMDVYDWKWNDPTATPAERWSWIQRQPSGLDWLSNFAAAHHKPIALPEWGLARRTQNAHGGGGDDPYFVRHLLRWARARHVAYETYFSHGKSRFDNFPRAARVYRHLEQAVA